jgi:hypothetical protein
MTSRLRLAARSSLTMWIVAVLFAMQFTPAAFAQKRKPAARPAAAPAMPAPTSLPGYLTTNTLLYIEAENVTGAIDEILNVESVKKFLASPDANIPFDPTKYETLLKIFGFPEKSVLSATKIGVSVSLPPPPPGKKKTAFPEPEFVVIIEAPTEDAANQYVAAARKLLGEASGKSDVEYSATDDPKKAQKKVKPAPGAKKPIVARVGRFEMTTFPGAKKNESFSYTREGRYVLGSQSVALKRLLTDISTKYDALAASDDFVKTRARMNVPRTFSVYFNTKAIGVAVRDGVAEIVASEKKRDKKTDPKAREKEAQFAAMADKLFELSGLGQLGGVGTSVGVKENTYYQQFVVGLPHAQPGLLPAVADGPVVSLRAADSLPENTQIFATTTLNAGRIFDTALEMYTVVDPKVRERLAKSEDKLGVALRNEIIAGLTGEFSFGVEGIDFDKAVKAETPDTDKLHAAAFAGVSNASLLRNSFSKLFAWGLQDYNKKTAKAGDVAATRPAPRLETYNGAELMIADEFAMTIFDDVLAVGRVNDVKWVVDSRKSGRTLGRSGTFTAAMANRPAETIASSYASEYLYQALIDSLKKETPKAYQVFLEGLSAMPFATHLGRDGDTVSNTFQYPLPIIVGFAGAAFGANEADRMRRDNESAVRTSLREIFEAQRAYFKGAGKGNYSDSLKMIARKADESRFFDEEVENMQETPRSGYVLTAITLRSGGFSIMARPVARVGTDRTGNHSFYLDETGKIRQSKSADAEASADDEVVEEIFTEEPATAAPVVTEEKKPGIR